MNRSKPKVHTPPLNPSKRVIEVKKETLSGNKRFWILASIFCGSTAIALIIRYLFRQRNRRHFHLQVPNQKFDLPNIPEHKKNSFVWDVCVVGSGPAGATCAYNLAKSQLTVLMVDKETFPRDKVCGDQVNPQAQYILSDMGILQSLIDDDRVKWSSHRGIVSPSGINFVAEIKEKESLLTVQRFILDHKLVEAAIGAGVEFKSKHTVHSASLNRVIRSELYKDGIWTVHMKDENNEDQSIRCRVLVCADGAESNLAHNLGGLTEDECPIVKDPNGIGCRVFSRPNTHCFSADDVTFYPKEMLPGHFRMSSELEGYLNLTCTSLTFDTLFHSWQLPIYIKNQFENAMKSDPWIKACLGTKCELTSFQTAPMSTGGIPKSYFPNGLIIGDACAQQDPFTGDGLHYGMLAAKMAAEVIKNAFHMNNFSESMFKKYDNQWKRSFSWDFYWSNKFMWIIGKCPILMDATSLVVHRQGIKAILFWAYIRAGLKSKWEAVLWFLRPDVSWLMCYYIVNLWLKKRDIL